MKTENTINLKLVFLLMAVCAVVWVCPTRLAAQATDNGGLSGTVLDVNKAVIPGVVVTARNVETGVTRTSTADGEGRWTLNVLPLGTYEVKFEKPGFGIVIVTASVQSGTTAMLNQTLGIEAQQETVDVTAQEGAVIDTTSATLANQVTGRRLENLPSVLRNPFTILATDASVSTGLTSALDNGNGNPELSINGSRTTSQSFLFNGIDATNLTNTGSLTENISPALETIREVKLLSSLYDASVGRSSGGNIQLVTKNGTNNFNGTAYIYAQNEKFNANDFFFNRDGIDRQRARRFEGGFAIGGPIVKDKLFFFGSYQKTDADTAYVPTAQSFVVLPLALSFITDRSNPENVRAAFRQGRVFVAGELFRGFEPGCIDRNPVEQGGTNASLIPCIVSNGVGFRLLNLRNPVTGDYVIPTIRPGAEILTTRAISTIDGSIVTVPLVDGRRYAEGGGQNFTGGNPLVRQRNASPAQFAQDQFSNRLDYNLFQGKTGSNQLNGTFFFANFPALDPFPDASMVSPFTLRRDDRNRTVAITDTHVFSSNLINEARFGYFSLSNSRRLDDPFLEGGLTRQALGIPNPAEFFLPGEETNRLPRFSGSRNLENFSVGAPNDVFNRRKQLTFTLADNVTWVKGNNVYRFGVESKRNYFDTNLPEEQGGEFERYGSFAPLLASRTLEADTQFGITDKQFRFNDLSFYTSTDWKVNSKLTLNLGVRWDWFGLPTEKNGRFSNFDFSRVTDPDDIRPGFILPSNARETGFNAIDATLPTIARADSKHTLNGQDLNNFAPRIGFAWSPLKNGRTVLRGGYGIFYDRPSAAFINTIYSNYPFLREIEATFQGPPNTLRIEEALANQNPQFPFKDYFPFRVGPLNNVGYGVLDNRPGPGNVAETLEFRAIDRDLKTPFAQQWNVGVQQQFGDDWLVEVRYVGSNGRNLMLGIGFNQPYDLNDPSTPDYIFRRFNEAYGGELPTGGSERERGIGIAYGACNNALDGRLDPGFISIINQNPQCINGRRDLNLDAQGFNLLAYDTRVPYLGFSGTDAVILRSVGYSIYHSGQVNVTKRLSKGISFNLSYAFSKSMDIGSVDPGSTTASGRPDSPNLGLSVQGDQRDIESNRALSDFDRPHRLAGSFVWELPTFGSKSPLLTGWQLSGFGQWQSGTPFSIYSSESEVVSNTDSIGIQEQFLGRYRNLGLIRILDPNAPALLRLGVAEYNLAYATGSYYRNAFARPSVLSLELLRRQGADPTRQYFNTQQFLNPDGTPVEGTALISPLGGFGNLGRNTLRGPGQKRIDLSLQKTTKLTERVLLELKWDIFNVFNLVNFANPESDLQDQTDFGQITRTVGAPRVMQFGAKVRF